MRRRILEIQRGDWSAQEAQLSDWRLLHALKSDKVVQDGESADGKKLFLNTSNTIYVFTLTIFIYFINSIGILYYMHNYYPFYIIYNSYKTRCCLRHPCPLIFGAPYSVFFLHRKLK